jgi:glycosyltransferase involved in cell wall biosynthesis
VGVVCENKQQLKILEIARSLHRKNPGLEVWFLGSADPQAGYARMFLDRMREVEAEGYAHYLGTAKNDEELVACFDQASALVHTPLFEAFGLVVAEALARNLKLFATSVGGITDIASGIEGAELFDPNDCSGLEAAITRWIRAGHPPPASPAALIRERYDPGIIARRHVEIYRKILSRAD